MNGGDEIRTAILDAFSFFYRERDVCPHFAVVLSGDIRVYKTGGMGREMTLYHVHDSEPCLVNLVSVMLARPAMANAVTEVETSAVPFPGSSLDSWMAASVPLRRFVFESIAERVVGVMTLVEEVAFQHMDSRLAALLLKRFGGRAPAHTSHNAQEHPMKAMIAAGTKPTDWLWLSASPTGCTFTITVNWAGFQEAKLLEVFVADGYAGTPILPTDFRVKNKEDVMTVTMPPLAPSATASFFYPWAQLIDTHGNAIPASLDFSGQQMAYCTAP